VQAESASIKPTTLGAIIGFIASTYTVVHCGSNSNPVLRVPVKQWRRINLAETN
jgi:hypothetical protein